MAERTLEEILVNLRKRVSLLERKRPGQAFLPGRLGQKSQHISDWNAATANGFYYTDSSSDLNLPTGSGLIVGIVTQHGNGNLRQQAWRVYVDAGVSDLRVWERHRSSGVWFPWVLTSNGDDATDSGWLSPTYVNGFTNGSSVGYRKTNGIVYLRGELLNSTAPVGTTQAFVLPVGYRPTTRLRTINWHSSFDPVHAVFLTVNTNGAVDIVCSVARTATPGYNLACSFPAD